MQALGAKQSFIARVIDVPSNPFHRTARPNKFRSRIQVKWRCQMTSTWILSIRSVESALPRGWLVAVGACFALALALTGPIQAQTTYLVKGTAGFETGIQKIATVDSISC